MKLIFFFLFELHVLVPSYQGGRQAEAIFLLLFSTHLPIRGDGNRCRSGICFAILNRLR